MYPRYCVPIAEPTQQNVRKRAATHRFLLGVSFMAGGQWITLVVDGPALQGAEQVVESILPNKITTFMKTVCRHKSES